MYGVLLVTGQLLGIAASLWFLLTHRPRQWRRLQALDAMGFPAIIAFVFLRSLVLTVTSWPVVARSTGSMIFSLLTMALVDAWMLVKLANFRRFVKMEKDSTGSCVHCVQAPPPL